MLSCQEGNVNVSLMHTSASNGAYPWFFLGLLKTFVEIIYEVKSKSDLTSFCSYTGATLWYIKVLKITNIDGSVKSKTEKEFSKIATSPHMARSSRGPPTHTVTVDNMNYSAHHE